MDRCLQVLAEKRIEKTIRNLQKNYMQGFHIHSREELFDKLEELIPAGNSVSFGGSMTLYETGVSFPVHARHRTILTNVRRGHNF